MKASFAHRYGRAMKEEAADLPGTSNKKRLAAPSWLQPVDLGASLWALDAAAHASTSASASASASSDSDGAGDESHDVHAWMKDVLRAQIGDGACGTSAGGESVQVADEGLDALATCLGGILERVLTEAKGGESSADTKELTSRDIHAAIKKLFKEEGVLRPVLPGVVKRSWKLDKESLKGVKKRKGGM